MMLSNLHTAVANAMLICWGCLGLQLSAVAQEPIDFNSQVKPILSDNCFACHGPDEAQRPTDLRLDDHASTLADLGGYSAIVPGDVANSELLTRVLSDDPDEVMPPSDYRKKLTPEQKRILVEWVKQGASWSKHWAFVSPEKIELVENADNNFIDQHIRARLSKENLKPSPAAEPHTLLRRLSFDLTGLPPTVEEVSAFDGRQSNYDAAVERLLASPKFGERMAVYWLDLVRYADSVGYHGDQPVSVTPYRDYVINAFNENKPFDQFTREQLAGDLIENPSQNQLIASGYNRLGMMSAEGGVQPEEYLVKYAADRVRTTASVWLGVTLGCAECHDHKFDPFTTKEFYEFAAFFADIKEKGLYAGSNRTGQWGTQIDVPNEGLQKLLQPYDEKIAKLESQLTELAGDEANQVGWEDAFGQKKINWQAIRPDEFQSLPKVDAKIQKDAAVLVSGNDPNNATYVITATLPVDGVRAVRLEVLPHKSLPKQGPGRAGNGNFVVTQFQVLRGDHLARAKELNAPVAKWSDELLANEIELHSATATVEQSYAGEGHPDKKWSAASALDRNKNGINFGWAILPDAGKSNEWVAQVKGDEPVSGKVTFVIQQNHGSKHTLGDFRVSATIDEGAVADPLGSMPKNVRAALAISRNDRNEKQNATLHGYYKANAPQFKSLNDGIANTKKEREKVRTTNTRTTLVTVAVPPREMRVLARGNWMDKTGEIVQPGVPSALGEHTWEARATRMDLANWIVAKENPIAARVFVNRLWRMFFGVGLSNVLDDLGSQGEPPSHPALLDRLAVEFVESGWDVKHIVRLIVSSETYRQSSAIRGELADVDPENRLLARQARFRLEAEFIRDNSLAVSGLLVDEVGGPNGKPYQPAGLYRHLNFPARKYQPAKDKNQYRRGVYTHWQRQFLHPAMKTFDAPSREECTAARPRSSTPLAALVMLNDPSYVESARVLADRVLEVEGSDNQRMNWLFLRAYSRPVRPKEVEVLSELLAEHTAHFSTHPAEAKSVLNIGLSESDSAKPIEERAAWTSVCRAVMNMHEFILRK